ncbi:MAG: MG2 domain-containing protein, partial [Bacteroidota bacterium]
MANAQESHSYPHLWKQVDQLESRSMTQSALKVVQSIAKKAEKEGNSPQRVKALLYTSKYAQTLEEDAQLKVVQRFKDEIKKAAFPTNQILKSYLAKLYWHYLQNNRYRFYNRTETASKVDPSDFRTWDLNTLLNEVKLHFSASLENPKALQKINVRDFEDILNVQKGSKTYRPTLYDLLAHTALGFYQSDENGITRPADQYELDHLEILCEAYTYTQISIPSKQKALLSEALCLYQELIRFHFPDPDLRPLADVDIERLKFIRQHAVFENKYQRYLEVLQNSAEALKHHEVSGLYRYEMAALYKEMGNLYQPKTREANRWKLKEALELCDLVIGQFPSSPAADKCRALKADILTESLTLTTERFVPVNSPSRILVNYSNLDGLLLMAYRATPTQIKHLNELFPGSKQRDYIQKLPLTKEWKASLTNKRDYQQHGMEVLLPPMENGHYVILAVPQGKDKASFAYGTLQVTDMAMVETRAPDSQLFQLIDRNNGKPLSKAHLELRYRENYDRDFIVKTFTTDSEGRIRIPSPNAQWTSLGVKASYNGETAYFGEYYIPGKRNPRERHPMDYKGFLFTDRSIYRPGQTLYFKGILTAKPHAENAKVQPNTPVTVTLRDVNYQEVSQQQFTTNDYGSFSGTFVLPSGGLTGVFTLQLTSKEVSLNSTAQIAVEEYKRPKFKASFEPVSNTFRINDSIPLKGTAMAYAGSPITEAQVRYRVKRVVHLPPWQYWSRPYFNGSPQEIAHGETVTDATGAFKIGFKAIPDKSVDKEDNPVFRYEVIADITDINGETRTATMFVRVGYHALTATISVPEQLDKAIKTHTITLATTNLNGQAVPTKGSLKIYKLKAPKHALRERPWPAPDYKNWDKTQFENLFPHDAFDRENDPATWEKESMVWETGFDTGKTTEIALPLSKKWASGQYVLELETRDRFGKTIMDKAFTALYGSKDKAPADKQLFRIQLDKNEYAVGDKARVILGSAAQDLYITILVEKVGRITETQIVHLDDDFQTFAIPVTKSDLGGFTLHYSFSAYNAHTLGTLHVPVPYPSTELEVEALTFRDKLSPGAEERWTFTLKGPKGEQVAAELLASMYDASLEGFRGHQWPTNLNPRTHNPIAAYSNAYGSFGNENFRIHVKPIGKIALPLQQYDSFDWFGLYFGNGSRLHLYREHAVKRSGPPPAMNAIASEEMEDSGMAFDMPPNRDNGTSNTVTKNEEEEDKTDFTQVPIRKNLQETAFFFPHLQTDSEGHVSFSFTSPEALTSWKLQLLGHTKDLNSGYKQLEAVTQKELMVLPNLPRFLREGDAITVSTKIANLSKEQLSGKAKLQLTDAVTGKDITQKILTPSAFGTSPQGGGTQMEQSFVIDSLGNTQVSWNLKIPKGLQAIEYTIVAKAGDFGDGEHGLLPVLTNRMLVT